MRYLLPVTPVAFSMPVALGPAVGSKVDTGLKGFGGCAR